MADLIEQKARIIKAGTTLSGIPAWYYKDAPEWKVRMDGLFSDALHANVINGDFESAEGRYAELNEGVEIAQDRIADWASDVETYGEG